MVYKKITATADFEGADIICAILLDRGITSFEVVDNLPEEGSPYDGDFEELKAVLPESDGRVRIIFYTEDESLLSSIKEEVLSLLPGAEFSLGESDEADWRDKWKEYFKPFEIGNILIKPSWEEVDPADLSYKSLIEIDPGISFGTGTHETTRMCIEALYKVDGRDFLYDAAYLAGRSFLDVGCGSGILSIAAHRLGSRNLFCIDIDPECITTTKENIEKNNIDIDDFRFICGNILEDESLLSTIEDESIDVICANILADIVIPMLPLLYKKLSKGGVIISSGIIEGKQERVQKAMKDHGLSVKSVKQDGEWFMVMGEK